MNHKVDYFGFVYQWTNSQNGKKYIGSHYGSLNDGYTGSGIAFKEAYLENPAFFSREILEFLLIDDKRLLLDLEQKWLDLVPDIRNHPEYYNLTNHSCGGFTNNTPDVVEKRAKTLVERQEAFGLTKLELQSYKTKIKNRLNRIKNSGFTELESKQHASYGCKILVITPNGEQLIFDSFAKATKMLNVDTRYGCQVCKTQPNYKGFRIVKLTDPAKPCYLRKKKNDLSSV